ncbi:RteC domain-containing protein [Rhizosphaericola mali]|uniref:Tetracycline regulation of excision, RteC n=1 Tax=Rhizosphaericola mali TaxID=2545455 RepID=A0A5P2G329_9BACT|nr:RteC domain-containing protein [Rhizosphaericola mali]QES88529.1 hypothetical protein E0W69_007595 [Rhizosphaericola mali]
MENYITQLWNRYISASGESRSTDVTTQDYNMQAIRAIYATILELRSFMHNYIFQSRNEQLKYHKFYAPRFIAEYIYFIQVQKLNISSIVSSNVRRKRLEKERRDINRFFEKNLRISEYLAGGHEYLDEKLFLNDGLQLEIPFLDESTFILEAQLITGAGFTIARLKAYERLLNYIEKLLAQEKINETESNHSVQSTLNWTDTGMSLTEMAYALKYSGAINQGNVDVKTIADALAQVFNTQQVNIYRNKQDLYSRKNQSMFIDKLRKDLIRGLEQSDLGS